MVVGAVGAGLTPYQRLHHPASRRRRGCGFADEVVGNANQGSASLTGPEPLVLLTHFGVAASGSAVVTQAAYGISLSIDAANSTDVDRMCPEVEKALTEIVQAHLNIANPDVRVEHHQEPSGDSRLLPR